MKKLVIQLKDLVVEIIYFLEGNICPNNPLFEK